MNPLKEQIWREVLSRCQLKVIINTKDQIRWELEARFQWTMRRNVELIWDQLSSVLCDLCYINNKET